MTHQITCDEMVIKGKFHNFSMLQSVNIHKIFIGTKE